MVVVVEVGVIYTMAELVEPVVVVMEVQQETITQPRVLMGPVEVGEGAALLGVRPQRVAVVELLLFQISLVQLHLSYN
jgi:hypothetical protein